jgi:iron complex outermembrane receptor protein
VPVGVEPGLLDLEAQKAWTAEIGSRGGIARASWDVSAYYAWIRNELLSYQTGPNQSTTLNADRTRHAGLELGGDVVPIDGLAGDGRIRVRGSYLFSWFRFDDDAQFGNDQIAGQPPQAIRVEGIYEFLGGWYAGPTAEAASAGYVDHANNEQAPGWGILGVKAGYRTGSGFSAWVEGRNLLNKTYAATYGVVTTATPASAVYNPGDGRAVYAGAGWRW